VRIDLVEKDWKIIYEDYERVFGNSFSLTRCFLGN
jgi:hypothetical protein